MPSSTDCLRQLVKIAHRPTQAEQEERVRKIAADLDDAGIEASGWITDEDGTSRPETLEDIAWRMYFSDSFGGTLLGTVVHSDDEFVSSRAVSDESPFRPDSRIADSLDRMAVALEQVVGISRHKSPVQRLAQTHGPSKRTATEEPVALGRLETKLDEIACGLNDIKERLATERGEVIKEAYTVEEVAEKTKLAPFTIRQACNKKRIKGAYKARDHAWRIPHASLLDILSNGLPPE